jgi:endonuclease/exonuclease/phosphatase family metal-dependent hydrolase
MTSVQYVECRARSWKDAADGLIGKLMTGLVKAGQIIAIDAHNNEPDGDAIVSAFYSTSLPDQGTLQIAYEYNESTTMSWDQLYSLADAQAGGKHVISITGSCNSNRGKILFVFFYVAKEAAHTVAIQHVEARGNSWNGAAAGIVRALAEKGIKSGQVLCVDAHNEGPDEDAIFSAHYSTELPPTGDFTLSFEAQNATYPWNRFYDNAASQIEDRNLKKEDIVGITGSCNMKKAVMYAFYWKRPGNDIVTFPQIPMASVIDGSIVPLRVVSFNIWCNGGDSLRQTIACIRAMEADVVCLQEASPATVRRVAKTLGLFFSETARVLSRFPVSNLPRDGTWSRGGDICAVHLLASLCVIVGNCHLRAYPYAPYALHVGKKGPIVAETVERDVQLPCLEFLLGDLGQLSRQYSSFPQVLCGDFNSASYLDYTQFVSGDQMGVAWPCSLACEAAGFVDTYVQANPDHIGSFRHSRYEAPGITWAAKPEQESHNVYDRIDFVYASSAHLESVARSVTVGNETPGFAPWPSDHRAVVSDLRLRVAALTTLPEPAIKRIRVA